MSQFVVRSVIGPLELTARMPLTASTLTCLPGADGRGEYWCAALDQPIRYPLYPGYDRSRCQPEFLGADADGDFLWVTVIAVWAADPARRLHPGMRDLQVHLAYVVDQTLGGDAFLDPAKIDVVATGRVDDVDENAAPAPAPVPAPVPAAAPAPPPAPPAPVPPVAAPRPPAPMPPPAVRVAGDVAPPRGMRVDEFQYRLSLTMAKMAGLTGIHPGEDSPIEAPMGDLMSSGYAGFDLSGPGGPRYRRDDPVTGWQTVSPGTLEELLYRIVDDVARALAWRWTESAPVAADGMPAHLRDDLADRYHRLLVAALDPDWGERTATALDADPPEDDGTF